MAIALALACLAAPSMGVAESAPAPMSGSPVAIDYFHDPDCPDCRRIEIEIIPELKTRYRGLIALNTWDLNEVTNIIRLLTYQDALGIAENRSVLIVVDSANALVGVDAIETRLFRVVEDAIVERRAGRYIEPNAIVPPSIEDGVGKAEDKVRGYALGVILVTGLIDGLNPCAIATLVFLMSLLAVSKVKGARLLLLGIPYCIATYVTYVSIGLGLLRAFRLASAARHVQLGVQAVIVLGLLVLSALSFRDALRYARRRTADAVAVKLPKRLMALSHAIMRRGIRGRHLALAGFGCGAAVTALEAVCTGQLYLPALALIIRVSDSAEMTRLAWLYLLAYNAMFVVPLIVVFFLAWQGLSNERLMKWSRSHVVAAKVAMGLLMLGLAAALAFWR